jgi:hypothetical protein
MTDAAPQVRRAPRRPGRVTVIAASVVVALTAGALVAIPLGGWDTVDLESAAVPQLVLGDEYEGRHYSVRVEEAWVGDQMPSDYDVPDEGMTFVVVRATVRNEWREQDAHVRRLLTFDALELLDRLDRSATVRLTADGTHPSMPPGVASEVLMTWEVPTGSVTAGEPLVVGIIDGRPDKAILYSGTAWRDERVVVETTVVPRPSTELEYPWES